MGARDGVETLGARLVNSYPVQISSRWHLRSGEGVVNPLVGTGRVQNCVELCVGQIIISDSVTAVFCFNLGAHRTYVFVVQSTVNFLTLTCAGMSPLITVMINFSSNMFCVF